MIPLGAGELAASPSEPWFYKMSDGKVEIIAPKQDMLAYSYAPDVRNRARLVAA